MGTREKILAGIIVIFFVCVVVWAIRTTPSEPPPIEKVEPPTVMEYEGTTLTEEKDGKIIWEITCDKMRIDSITQDMELTNVKGKFYDEETTWELTSKRGIYELRSEELSWLTDEETLTAMGDVHIKKDDGSELFSDELIWFSKEEIITATGNVRVKDDEGAKLRSDKLEWLSAEAKLIATGNVKISKDDMRAFGDLAYAENDFKKFGLLGNAKVLDGVKDEDETMNF